jgi:hypothetical protein
MTFAARRLRIGFAAILLALVVLFGHAVYAATLGDARFLSGYMLLALVVFLALYGLRRRVPFLPLGSSARWLQAHILTGGLGVVVFAVHVDWTVPQGVFEIALAIAFLVVAGSGVIGLFLSRYLPARLSSRGEDLLFDRIPVIRREILERAEALVMEATTKAQTSTIADYYSDRLRAFFDRPCNFWSHIVESGRPRRRILAEMTDLDRYLDREERRVLGEIRGLVVAKDDTDYQHALQSVLRYWTFAHVPMTNALLLLLLVHVVAVHAFA